jgi:uncharacterized membrane protein
MMPSPLNRPVYWLTVSILLVWCAVLTFYPWLVKKVSPDIPRAVFYFFSHICHQRPERSLRWGGVVLPVCLRCFSTYTGALAAALIFPWVRQWLNRSHLQVLFLGALSLVGADVGFGWLGWQDPSGITRVITGILLGGSLIWLLLVMFEMNPLSAKKTGHTVNMSKSA